MVEGSSPFLFAGAPCGEGPSGSPTPRPTRPSTSSGQAENYASGGYLTMTASARVCRTRGTSGTDVVPNIQLVLERVADLPVAACAWLSGKALGRSEAFREDEGWGEHPIPVRFLRPLVSLLLRDNDPIGLANVPSEGIVVDTGKIDSDPSATTDIGRTVIDRRILFDDRLLQTRWSR